MLNDLKFRITISKPGIWILYVAFIAKHFKFQKAADMLSTIALNNFLSIK